jgi:hypothetical protein
LHRKKIRYPKLSENAGYGIEKISRWESLTGNAVTFHSDLLVSTVEYPLTQPKLAELTGFSLRKVNRIIAALRESGKIKRIGKTKGGHWEIID